MNTHRLTGTPTGSPPYRGLQKNYFNILIGKYFNRKIFFTGTHRQEDRTPTQATGSPLLARSPSRSMMIHRKGNEHSQGPRDTGTPTQGRHPYRLLPLATTDTGDRLALARSYPYRRIPTQEGHRQEDRNTQGRHPRPCCSPLLALALPLGL